MTDYSQLEKDNNLPPGFLSAVEQQESGGDPNAVSSAGAQGLFQFMPATAKQYGIDPLDPDQAAQGAAKMYGDLSQKYNGDLPSMLAAYNWGQGNLDKHGLDNAPAETKNYIASITKKLGSPNTQYAAADTGDTSDATVDNTPQDNSDLDSMTPAQLQAELARLQTPSDNSDLDSMTPAQLQAELARLQSSSDLPGLEGVPNVAQDGSQTIPQFLLNGTPKPDFWDRQQADLQKHQTSVDASVNRQVQGKESPVGTFLNSAGQGVDFLGDTIGNIVGSGAREINDAIPQSVKNSAQDEIAKLPDILPDSTQQGFKAVGNAIGQANNYAETKAPVTMDYLSGLTAPIKAYGMASGLEGGVKNAVDLGTAGLDVAKSAADKVSNILPDGSGFLGDETSKSAPLITATNKAKDALSAPTISPQSAQLAQNAENLGIHIPLHVLAPGDTSAALDAAGLLPESNTKDQIITALSKTMGHEGTANLDIDTMNGIQDDLGTKMNNFAAKADDNGGIPISTKSLNTIAENSLADESKVKKLISKIQDRVDEDGTISGGDYQDLTKKGSVLDKAMNSSDSDLADTASELRDHLDDQLQKSVNPEDLNNFLKTKQQYRTYKIVQPLVKDIEGQDVSGTALYNKVVKNYGTIQNAAKYNPDLATIAQVGQNFPQTLETQIPNSTKIARNLRGNITGAADPNPATQAVKAAVNIAKVGPQKVVAKVLSSPARRAATIAKSLPVVDNPEGGAAVDNLIARQARVNAANVATPETPPTQLQIAGPQKQLQISGPPNKPALAPPVNWAAPKDIGPLDMVADGQGGMRLMTPAEQNAANVARQRASDLGNTPDVIKNNGGFKKGGLITPQFTHSQWTSYLAKGGRANGHKVADKTDPVAVEKAYQHVSAKNQAELTDRLGRQPSQREVEMAHYVGAGGVHRLLKQGNDKMPAHKMFPKDLVNDQKSVFFNKNKPYSVKQLKDVMS